jgi:hypothetical protein
VEVLGGIGSHYAAELADAGIGTVEELARAEPLDLRQQVPLIRLVEFRAKARLTLRTASELPPVPGLYDRTVWEVLVTPTATLAADAGVAEEVASRVREKVSALELTLDHRFLRRVTLAELVGAR